MELLKFLSLPKVLYLKDEKSLVNRYGCTITRKMVGLYTQTLGIITVKDIGKRFIVDQYPNSKMKEYIQ